MTQKAASEVPAPSEATIWSIVDASPDIGADVIARALKVLDQIEYALDTAHDVEQLRGWLRTMWRTLTGDEQTEPDERGVMRRG